MHVASRTKGAKQVRSCLIRLTGDTEWAGVMDACPRCSIVACRYGTLHGGATGALLAGTSQLEHMATFALSCTNVLVSLHDSTTYNLGVRTHIDHRTNSFCLLLQQQRLWTLLALRLWSPCRSRQASRSASASTTFQPCRGARMPRLTRESSRCTPYARAHAVVRTDCMPAAEHAVCF